jgi:hypothetical protein|tara:strand:+ start:135 stop:515 length:381 start_codon:yes stop_codon:yes gene_type:complete
MEYKENIFSDLVASFADYYRAIQGRDTEKILKAKEDLDRRKKAYSKKDIAKAKAEADNFANAGFKETKNKGGLSTKNGKAKMMRGGMANKKEHMYVAGGSVTDKMNPGLRALNKTRPDVVKQILDK